MGLSVDPSLLSRVQLTHQLIREEHGDNKVALFDEVRRTAPGTTTDEQIRLAIEAFFEKPEDSETNAELSVAEQIRFDALRRAFGRSLTETTFDEAEREMRLLHPNDERLLQLVFQRAREDLRRIYEWPDIGGVFDPNRTQWWLGGGAHWASLRQRLSGKLDESTLASLDETSDKIIGSLPPTTNAGFAGRGLVMGYVQSGKTTSFMTVAAKAADSGYKVIIVLSGVTNNLRSQTQSRLEEFLTGREGDEGENKWIKLTSIESDFSAWQSATALVTAQGKTVLAVVKKNRSRLEKLKRWLGSIQGNIRAATPVLIIDDESDQASVNTARQKNVRTAVNRALTQLLSRDFLPKVSYIGYSATPFANLLADATDEEDVFPRDFVYSLPKGDGYFGPEQLFGASMVEEDDDVTPEVDVIRDIPNSDVDLIKPPRRKVGNWTPSRSESLLDSMAWFLFATACRSFRGHRDYWSSMLVHVSPNVRPHSQVRELLVEVIEEWQLDSGRLIQRLDDLLQSENQRLGDDAPDELGVWCNEHRTLLESTVLEKLAETKVVVDNYASEDRLNYDQNPHPVIVVGGNTLARGLTLEGLVSSFFLRTSNAYDSLLQMGRWFGYRPGYEDLQRIWMANESPYSLSNWFRKLAFVEQEIREEIEVMAASGLSPIAVGVKIRSLPGMAITAAAKMRHAVRAQISYSGSYKQTVVFPKDLLSLEANVSLTNKLAEDLSSASGHREANGIRDGQAGQSQQPSVGGNIFHGVSSERVTDFVEQFVFHEGSTDLQGDKISEYIKKLNSTGELLEWNVVFYDNSSAAAKKWTFGDSGLQVRMATRTKLQSRTDSIDIKTLISTSDLVADNPSLLRDLEKPLKKTEVRLKRKQDALTGGRGLLGIYVIDPSSAPSQRARLSSERAELGLPESTPLVGLYFVFPDTNNPDASVKWVANVPDFADLEEAEDIDDDEIDAEG